MCDIKYLTAYYFNNFCEFLFANKCLQFRKKIELFACLPWFSFILQNAKVSGLNSHSLHSWKWFLDIKDFLGIVGRFNNRRMLATWACSRFHLMFNFTRQPDRWCSHLHNVGKSQTDTRCPAEIGAGLNVIQKIWK